jgi:Lipid A 3-O-deacylase (PagL)
MNKKAVLILVGLNAFFAWDSVFAQDTSFTARKDKIGFMKGDGFQYIGQLLGNDNHRLALKANYYYRVTFYQLQYYFTVSDKKTFGIDILAQPQYNLTKYKPYDDATNYLEGYEAGINIGLLLRKKISNDRLSFYLLLSVGPHYASATPHRQSNGFLFSDNLDGGLNFRLYKKLYFDIRPGFRHISNARIKLPNAGVNDMTVTEGFLVSF